MEIDKAAMNAVGIVLHDSLAQKGIFVGSVFVGAGIVEGYEKYNPALIAKQYWKMHTNLMQGVGGDVNQCV